MWIFPNVLDIVYVFKLGIFLKIILISIVAWAPFYIANRIAKYFFPKDIEKLKINN